MTLKIWWIQTFICINMMLIGSQRIAARKIGEADRRHAGTVLKMETRSDADSQDVKAPRTSFTCPLNTTRCDYGPYSRCCPLEKGICCTDMEHCCPESTVCDSITKSCVTQNNKTFHPYIALEKTKNDVKEKVRKSNQKTHKVNIGGRANVPLGAGDRDGRADRLFSIFCPDQRTMCDDGCTCCWMYTRCWGCCPYLNAVCCPDLQHCCPHGWTCNESTGYCENTIDGTWIPAAGTQCGQRTIHTYRLLWRSARKIRSKWPRSFG